jgi:hypothetical protein
VRAPAVLVVAASALLSGCPVIGTSPQCPSQALSQPLPVASLACNQPAALAALIAQAQKDEQLASQKVRGHLESHGYTGHVRSFPLEDGGGVGELLLAGPEAIDDQGAPLAGPARWINVGSFPAETLADYLRLAFSMTEARSRVLIVTLSRTVEPESGAPSLKKFQELAECRSQISPISDLDQPLVATLFAYEFIRVPSERTRAVTVGERRTTPELLMAQLDLGTCP